MQGLGTKAFWIGNRALLIALILLALFAMSVAVMPSLAYADDVDAASGDLTAASDTIASGVCGSCSWSIDSDGKLSVEPSDGASGTLDSITLQNMAAMHGTWESTAPWIKYASSIKSAYIAPGVKSGEACALFSGLSNLESVDVNNLDTSGANDLNDMFCFCQKLTSVDLSGLDVSNVTRMSEVFRFCTELKDINLSGLDTTKAGNAQFSMFYGCELQQLTLGPKTKLSEYVSLPIGSWKLQDGDSQLLTADLIAVSGTDAGAGTWLYSSEIPAVDISSEAVVNLSENGYSYNGKAHVPSVESVIFRGYYIEDQCDFEYSDSQSANAGTYTVTARAKQDSKSYKGSVTASYTISPTDLSQATVNLSATSFVENGSAQHPEVLSVEIGSSELPKSDYSVSFSNANSTAAGGYSVTVAAASGNVKGETTVDYKIVERPAASSATPSNSPANAETAGDIAAAIGDKAEVSGTQYEVVAVGTSAAVAFNKAPQQKKAASIPANVTIGGVQYAVVGIAKGAFKNSKAKTVTIASKLLTKKSVKNCFKGSKVKVVKVPKSKLKAYKKIFTKKNCGAKVKVRAK